MTHTITIERMEFRAAHGCYDVERLVGGNFTVDVTLDVEDDGAAEADEVTRTVNYVEVYETVRRQISVPSRIIENVAHRIVEAIEVRFPQVRRIEVTISKLAPPIGGKAAKVSVTFKKDISRS